MGDWGDWCHSCRGICEQLYGTLRVLAGPSTTGGATRGIGQLRDATSDVTAGFAALAETMRPDGNLIDTSRRAYELGDKLRDFGRLHERYWSQVLGSLGISDEPRGR